MEPKEFEALVKRAQKGDQDAFTDLYNETLRAVYANCYNILGNAEDANDATQDTFVKAFGKLSDLDDPSRFAGWIKRIAVNTAINMKRGKTADVAIDTAIDSGALSDADTNIENLPEEYITQTVKREILAKIIKESLSDVQYQTIYLYYYDNLSVAEIAEIMGVPEGTVKTRLNSSRAKIKEKIKMYEEENDDKLNAALPFLTRFFIEDAKTLTLPSMGAKVSAAITAAAGAGTAGTAAGTSFISTVASKALIGIIGAAILGSGIFGIYKAASKNTRPEETTVVTESAASTPTPTPEPTSTPTPSPTPTPAILCEINEETFPDPVFREYVLADVDKDSDGFLSQDEADRRTNLKLSVGGTYYSYMKGDHEDSVVYEYDYGLYQSVLNSDEYAGLYADWDTFTLVEKETHEKISSLKGIEYFTNLRTIYCSNHNLTEVDLTKNTKLTTVDLSHNDIETLDVSTLTALSDLNISCTKISTIDVSNCKNLRTLNCSSLMDNKKSSESLGADKLIDLPESEQQSFIITKCVEYLDVSACTKLKTLSIDSESMGTTLVGASDTTEITYTTAFSPSDFWDLF